MEFKTSQSSTHLPLIEKGILVQNKASFFDNVIILTVSLFSLSFLFFISYFGSPLTDEGFPFATAYRFLMGQKPFVDDFSSCIPLGLLLAPLIKLSQCMHGGLDGLILFTRQSYICFSFLLAYYSFLLCKKVFQKIVAFFTATCLLVYHPFGINNFHYDTLATLLWTVVVFQAFIFLVDSKCYQHKHFLLFSLLNLILCMVYPPFIFLLIVFNIGILFLIKKKQSFLMAHVLIVLLSSIALVYLLFGYFGLSISNLKNEFSFLHHLMQNSPTYHGLTKKPLIVIKQMLPIYTKPVFFNTLLLIVAVRLIKYPLVTFFLIILTLICPLFFIESIKADYSLSFYYLNSMGFTAAIFMTMFVNNTMARKLFFFIWIPSFLAGILTSTSSTNFSLNFGIGFFPTYILSFVFIFLSIKDLFSTHNNNRDYLFTRGILLVGLSFLFFFQFNYIYGVSQSGVGTYKNNLKFIQAGPFRGLYLEEITYKLVNSLQSDLKLLDTDPNKFIYLGFLSGAYLLVEHLKPGDYVLYCDYAINHFNMKVRTPNYIINCLPAFSMPDQPFLQYYLTGAKYHKFLQNTLYRIYEGT